MTRRTISRRRFVLGAGTLTLSAPFAGTLLAGCGDDDESQSNAEGGARPQTGEEALAALIEGNERFATGEAIYPRQDSARRADLAEGQQPFAIVLGCIDSRVPHELLFDVGLGDIFSVRVAGNYLDTGVLGSIEFGVVELAVPLIVVLGHQSCGAMTAAVETIESGGTVPGNLSYIVDSLEAAFRAVEGDEGDVIDNAVRENVRMAVAALSEPGTTTGDAVAEGRLQVVGMQYALESGRVEEVAR